MHKRGFTLVEMIVSLAIFSVVAVVALTALMSIMAANRKAQTLQSSITNLSFAMEAISREMRVGNKYHCTPGTTPFNWGGDLVGDDCDENSNVDGSILAFNSAKTAPDLSADGVCNLIFAYNFVPDAAGYDLKKAEQSDCGDDPLPENDFSSVIDEAVVITSYHISVSPVARKYPYVVIGISGYAGDREKDRTYFDLQTAVSARTR